MSANILRLSILPVSRLSRVLGSLAAVALVVPIAACGSSDNTPEQSGTIEQATAEPADEEIQNVEVTVPAPSAEEQDSQHATVLALASYLEVQIMFSEYLDMAESPSRDLQALEALWDQIEAALPATEELIRGAALALQAEYGEDWRDESLLDSEDLAGGDEWATSAAGEGAIGDVAASAALDNMDSGFGALETYPAAYVPGRHPTVPMKTWEERFTAGFDQAQPGRQLGSLATMLNTDVKTVKRLLDSSQGVVRDASLQDADTVDDALFRVTQGRRSALKVVLIGAGIAATYGVMTLGAPVLAGVAGVAICVQGADMVLEIVKG